MKNLKIELVNATLAEQVCRSITASLPEWFGIPEANERYAKGMLDRLSIAAVVNNDYVGMITLEFFYPKNGNIYWMAVKKGYQDRQIGTSLLRAAENYCNTHGCDSLTVETLSPKQDDSNYLKTYRFYEKSGFNPLFEMHTYDPENLMVYMQKSIGLKNFTFIDLTHSLSPEISHWSGGCGFQHTIELDYADCNESVKFRAQKIEMHAGIGTHMDAPAHCIPGGLTIEDITLKQLITSCIVIDVTQKVNEKYSVSCDDIHDFENKYGTIVKDTFVMIYTGWERFWNQPEKYRNNLIFPSVSDKAAQLLLKRDIMGLGIDTLSPDREEDGFPVHQLLLNAGKYIIENVANCKQLPPTGASTIALPIKIKDGTEAPIRLIGVTYNFKKFKLREIQN